MSVLKRAGLLLLLSTALHAAQITGKVVNVNGGEPLGRVQLVLLENGVKTVTSNDGTFSLPDVAPGTYTLRCNAVGYRLLTIPVVVTGAAESKDISISMAPDNFRRTDVIEVKGDIFRGPDSPAINETTVIGTEIKETATVLADDPFRSLQTLPGVSPSGNNDFFAQFSVMGAPYTNVGVYVDDVLVANPFHGIPDFPEGASLGVLTSDSVETLKLMPAAYPQKYGDYAGAALDIRTRDGSRTSPLFRASVGVADTELLGEGRIGPGKRGSWLASARKSYLGYLVRNRVQAPFTDISFYDGDVKLTYDLSHNQNVNLYTLTSHTDVDITNPDGAPGPNDFQKGTDDFTLARVGWRWGISPNLFLDTRANYIRTPLRMRNAFGQTLTNRGYHEEAGGTALNWAWSKDHVLEAGLTTRRQQSNSYLTFFGSPSPFVFTFRGTALRNDAFIQNASSFLGNRVHIFGGLRWDGMEHIGVRPFSPQVSMAVRAASSTYVQFGFGRYAQLPSAPDVGCFPYGNLMERSNHYTAAVEQRIGDSIRLHLEFFDRQNSTLIGYRPGVSFTAPPPASCSGLQPVPGSSVYQTDYSRGTQLVLQRRSANRLSGWIGYTLVTARARYHAVTLPGGPPLFSVNSGSFPTLEDQRHALSAFVNYRLTPSLNFSGKWLYGSGFPVPSGDYIVVGNTYFSKGVNESRLGPYERLDIRTDKDWAFRRWKMTLYGEVLNLTKHDNRRYITSSVVDPNTGQTSITTQRGLPITPAGGLVFEF